MSTELSSFVSPPLRRWRLAVAVAAAVLAPLVLVVTVLGMWNPWSSVLIRLAGHRLAQPMREQEEEQHHEGTDHRITGAVPQDNR